jgi:hypothetical protein
MEHEVNVACPLLQPNHTRKAHIGSSHYHNLSVRKSSVREDEVRMK